MQPQASHRPTSLAGAGVPRVALVTGASSGIGEAVARRLLAGGWTVYAGARRVDRMAPLAAAGAQPIALDVSIARAGLLATSGATAYAEQARLAAALLEGANRESGAPPAVVADAVWAALTERRPDTRYAVGGGAALLLRLRRLLSDRAFDAVMRAAAARMARSAAGVAGPGADAAAEVHTG